MSMMNCSLDNNLSLDKEEFNSYIGGMTDNSDTAGNMSYTTLGIDNGTWGGTGNYTCWDYWTNNYYPQVIRESYPVYIQERAKDKGKQAFEIIKILKDKKAIHLKTVGDFIDLMDELIKIL